MIFGPLRLVLRLLSLLVSLVVVYFIVSFVQVWLTGHEHSHAYAQGILVFGTTEDNGKPSLELKDRLNQALYLYDHHRAPWLVVTGGKRPGDTQTEAQVSATYLEKKGVPTSAIIVGSGSDTWKNVSSVIGQLKHHDIAIVLCVTDPFHEYRAMAIASSQGLRALPSPVSHSPTSNYSLWKYYLKETLEVGVGRLIGYGTLSSWTSSSRAVGAPAWRVALEQVRLPSPSGVV